MSASTIRSMLVNGIFAMTWTTSPKYALASGISMIFCLLAAPPYAQQNDFKLRRDRMYRKCIYKTRSRYSLWNNRSVVRLGFRWKAQVQRQHLAYQSRHPGL